MYKYILAKEKTAKSDIADDLDLSLPTVLQYVSELMSLGLIIENGKFQSTGGRKATGVSCKEDARLAIGVDITKNHINIVLVNLRGVVLDSKRIRHMYSDSEEYNKFLGDQIYEIIHRNNIEENRILGVGISVVAIVSCGRGIEYASLIKIPYDFYDKLKPYIHFPYRLFNDSNSGGFAEQWMLKSSETIVYFSLSDTVGGSIITNGDIYYGDNWRSGELGHMILIREGKRCYCGRYGCLDCYCASHVLSDYTDGSLERFFEYVDAGDKKYVDIFEQYLNYLVISIHNLRMCYDCDIILGGYMGKFLSKYLDHIKQLVKEKNMFQNEIDFIKTGRLSFEAAALGGALYYIDEFINNV